MSTRFAQHEADKTYREIRVRLPSPHPQQRIFIEDKSKRKVVRAGRRGGKTFGVAILAVQAFLSGRRVLYATPTSDQFMRFWDLVKQFLGPTLAANLFAKNENFHVIQNPGTDSRIKAKTAWNADSLRGDYADLLILDEYQLMSEDAWEVVGAPMLLDNGGDAIFIYTPPSIRTLAVSKARDKKHASKLFKRAQQDTSGRWRAFSFTSHDNPFLDRESLQEIATDMTAAAYKQEILAEEIDEIPGALWTRQLIEETRAPAPDEFRLIVVGVDPKVTEKRGNSETGIIVAGLSDDGHIYILGDYSTNAGPDDWAKTVLRAMNMHNANRVVVEVNQGGALVKSVLRHYDKTVNIHQVRASRGKALRAEPVAALFEQGKAHLIQEFYELEDQMTSFTPGDRHSPDRLDAMVWACTALSARKSNIVDATSKYSWT